MKAIILILLVLCLIGCAFFPQVKYKNGCKYIYYINILFQKARIHALDCPNPIHGGKE